jgi:hypothetical protein
LQAHPGDGECALGTNPADCPQKNLLTQGDWQSITGADPDHYDFTGIDPHMIESEQPRSGLPCSPAASDNCDPINGREWATNKKDLQFACIFPLVDPNTAMPAPKDCTAAKFSGACDCATGSNTQDTPLCQKSGSAYTNTQIYGKAYPSLRAMEIAHAMAASRAGVQGVVSSLCPIHTSFADGLTDPLFGYRSALNPVVNRLKDSIAVQCLPNKLIVQSDGTVSCVVVVAFPTLQAGESYCGNPSLGLSTPTADIVASFQQDHGLSASVPVCLLNQIATVDAEYANCAHFAGMGARPPGWCYVEGPQNGPCGQGLWFTAEALVPTSVATVQCSDQP